MLVYQRVGDSIFRQYWWRIIWEIKCMWSYTLALRTNEPDQRIKLTENTNMEARLPRHKGWKCQGSSSIHSSHDTSGQPTLKSFSRDMLFAPRVLRLLLQRGKKIFLSSTKGQLDFSGGSIRDPWLLHTEVKLHFDSRLPSHENSW